MKKITKVVLIAMFVILVLVMLSYIIIKRIYPNDKYSEYVIKYAEEYNVNKNLIYAIIKQESNFNEEACSSKGAIGLMQVMKDTAFEVVRNTETIDLYNPEINIKIGTKYLSELLNKYEDERIAIAAYNAGSGNVDKWISSGIIDENGENLEKIPYKETNMYVRKVVQNYEMYERLY